MMFVQLLSFSCFVFNPAEDSATRADLCMPLHAGRNAGTQQHSDDQFLRIQGIEAMR